MRELRPYQLEAVEKCDELLSSCERGVILSMPTGGGKTRTAAALVARRPGRTVVLAHRNKLVAQLRDALNDAGVITTDRPGGFGTLVGTFQALARHASAMGVVDTLLIDECHRASSSSLYAKVYQALRMVSPGLRTFGLSATPFRLDGKGLLSPDGLFDTYHTAVTPRQLLEMGVLVPVDAFAYEAMDLRGVRKTGGDYNSGDMGRAASRINGDVVAEWLAHAAGLQTIVFCANILHAEGLLLEFRTNGVLAELVTGKMTEAQQEAQFAKLESRAIDVLLNVNLVTEGVDIPALECVVLARATQSEALYLQMLGRVLRSSPGKTKARVHDHAGNWVRHGGPYDERDFTPRHDRPRGSAGAGSQAMCPECAYIVSASAWTCPNCGHVFRTLTAPEAMTEAQRVQVASATSPLAQAPRLVDLQPGRTVEGPYLGAEKVKAYSHWNRQFYHKAQHKVGNALLSGGAGLDAKLSRVSVGTVVRVTRTAKDAWAVDTADLPVQNPSAPVQNPSASGFHESTGTLTPAELELLNGA
jgi:DNA repair protein RadD